MSTQLYCCIHAFGEFRLNTDYQPGMRDFDGKYVED
jgi:hypothetical protein